MEKGHLACCVSCVWDGTCSSGVLACESRVVVRPPPRTGVGLEVSDFAISYLKHNSVC